MPENKQHFNLIIAPLLKGMGQILLQKSSLSGLLILIGICCGSLLMGLAAIIGVSIGTVIAWLLKYDNETINDGMYGFSATLVAVALASFFQLTPVIWIGIIAGSVIATIIQHYFIIKKIQAFTFPFILYIWLFLVASHYFSFPIKNQLADTIVLNGTHLFPLTFGEVILQGNIWAGIFFFSAILINQPIAAIFAVVSVAISSIIAYRFNEPSSDINMGMLGYNAVVCAIVFAGDKLENVFLAFISIVLSVLIMIQMRHMNLPALTFPFVLSTWITLIIKKAKHTFLLQSKK